METVEPDLGERFALGYRLTRALGHGAMGDVWLAERASDRMPVAIK